MSEELKRAYIVYKKSLVGKKLPLHKPVTDKISVGLYKFNSDFPDGISLGGEFDIVWDEYSMYREEKIVVDTHWCKVIASFGDLFYKLSEAGCVHTVEEVIKILESCNIEDRTREEL